MSMSKTTTDPIESSRRILNAPASTLPEFETAAAALNHVRDELDVEVAGMTARRREILASDAPAHEVDRQLEKHDETVGALVRRSEVVGAINAKLSARLMAAREEAAEETRQANFAAALALHLSASKRVKEFCGRVGSEAAEVMQLYRESEAATLAANKDRPAGAPIIPSIEQERQGGPTPPRITERHFKAFVRGQDFVCEVGRVEAVPTGGNTWNLFLPSNSVQGGTSVGGCELVDFVDLKIERFEPQRPPSLVSSLSIPEFFAPAPIRGAIEKKRMRLDDWRAINGEPAEHFPALAAE
jgi:hypothetical protein